MIVLAICVWLAAGLSFWVASLIHNDLPRYWTSRPDEPGWVEVMTIYLLVCLVAGPGLWIAAGVVRLRRAGS